MQNKDNRVNYPVNVSQVQFSPLDEETLRKLSVIKITNHELYDPVLKTPRNDGPISLFLGLSRKDGICLTCKKGIEGCTGHFGYYELKSQVFHFGFYKQIYKILKLICKNCGKLISKENFICECNFFNGKIKKIQNKFLHYTNEGIELLLPEKINSLFKIVPLNTKTKLGFKSLNFIIKYLIIPPNNIRPSVVVNTEQRNEDDVSIKLAELIYTSNNISNVKPLVNYLEEKENLQNCFNSLIVSDKGKGLLQRLKGKTGRFRGNLNGKRVDFTGRTVISPDPNLSIQEVGVPIEMARLLTIPEKVTFFNIKKLQQIILNSQANLIKKDENLIFLKFGNKKENSKNLKIGDIVERHLINGDIILFNRQPSLHRLSIMAHRVRVLKSRTLRFNECVCTPYNADFDGDEMNIHILQTEFSRAEAEILMEVKNNIFSPRHNLPLIAIIQDFITSSYLITSKNTFFTDIELIQLIPNLYIRTKPTILRPLILYTGKKIFEAIFSKLNIFNLESKNRNFISIFHPNDSYLIICRNKYLFGRLDKNILGSENKIFSKLSNTDISFLLDCVSKVSSNYLSSRGFSIGLDDVEGGFDLEIEKRRELVSCFSDSIINRPVSTLNTIENHHSSNNNNPTHNISSDSSSSSSINKKDRCINSNRAEEKESIDNEGDMEQEISNLLSKVREQCGNLCIKYLSINNKPIIMQDCGSKGSKINVSQMVSCVGQQIISGKRIPLGFKFRTLPHFINSTNPISKGFVSSSFRSGLNEPEFFFHAVSGREGLVDTAVKTAETGYMQRRLMKALEDIAIKYDSTVRGANLIQYEYKEEGVDYDSVYLEMKNDILFSPSLVGFTPSLAYNTGTTNVNCSNNLNRDIESSIFTNVNCSNNINSEDLNTNINRYTGTATVNSFITSNRENEQVLNKLVEKEKSSAFKKIYNSNSEIIRKIFYNKIKAKNTKSDYLTAVGALAGQSLGEPGTQMTLKTFHFAGVASMNITLGVPRIKELINAVKNISTPIIKADILVNSLNEALILKGKIEKIFFKQIIKSITEIYLENDLFLEVQLCLETIKKLHFNFQFDQIKKLFNKEINCTFLNDKITFSFNKEKDKYFLIKEFKRELKELQISNLKNIIRVLIVEENNIYKLFIEGNNFKEILNLENINFKTTSSNSIVEVNEVLGIEACREKIIQEINYTISSHGIKIDLKHLELLSDMMTSKGVLLGITRFGISKYKINTLMLASFEQTGDHLFESAAKNRSEEVKGVSECIIVGKKVCIGTGDVDLIEHC